jgi:hypothetical protein
MRSRPLLFDHGGARGVGGWIATLIRGLRSSCCFLCTCHADGVAHSSLEVTSDLRRALDASRGFFDAMAHSWIVRFLEHRVADKRILRLIAKWLKVGITENGS